MRRTRILATMIGAAVLAPTLAFATEYQVVNGEAGIVFRDAPSTLTREEVRSGILRRDAGDGWQYVGGEAVWSLPKGATFLLEGGQLVHASDCPVIAAAVVPAAGSRTGGQPLPGYSGA